MLTDEAHFFRSLVAAPRATGAVAPSGRALARAMAAAVGDATRGLIVELGPGTGPVTRALLDRGVERNRLILIEFDPRFCRILAERFGPAGIVQGDAYDLPRTLRNFAGQPIGAIVSSLPLLNEPTAAPRETHRRRLLAHGAGRPFRAIHLWSVMSPIPREACARRYSARRAAPIWLNLPPARVWTYRLAANREADEAPRRELKRGGMSGGRAAEDR